MKNIYFISIYAVIFFELLVVLTYYSKYITVKKRWIKLFSFQSKPVYLKIKWFRFASSKAHKARKDICSHLIVILSAIGLIADISNLIYIFAGHQGAIINNTFNLLQFILLSIFYHYLYEQQASFRKKKIAQKGIIVVLVFAAIQTYFIGNYHQYQTFTWIVQSFILVLYSLYSFMRLRGGPLIDDREVAILNEQMYNSVLKVVSAPIWFNLAILIYFGGCILIAVLEIYIAPHLFVDKAYVQEVYLFWLIHNVLHITKDIFFAIGVYRVSQYGMHRRLSLPPKAVSLPNQEIIYN